MCRALESSLEAPISSLRAALSSLQRDKARVSSLGEQELLSLLAGLKECLKEDLGKQRERLVSRGHVFRREGFSSFTVSDCQPAGPGGKAGGLPGGVGEGAAEARMVGQVLLLWV